MMTFNTYMAVWLGGGREWHVAVRCLKGIILVM